MKTNDTQNWRDIEGLRRKALKSRWGVISLPRNILACALMLMLSSTALFAQEFQFATSFGATSEDSGEDLVIDSQGNVIITGLFAGTVDFDTGSGVFNMTSAGQDDGFVAKYDDDGNFLWAVQFGGSSSDFGHGISVDQNDNVVVTGSFEETADFLPASGGPTFISQGAKDIFILKLDTNGALVWVESMGGSDDDNGHDIDVDGAGNIHLAGAFSTTVDFDPGAGTSNLTSDGNLDLFLARYDASGNFLWAFNGEGGNANQRVWAVNADDAGNSYVSGWFKNTPDMDPGPGVFLLPNEGLADGWLGKYDSDGNLLWVFNFGSASRDQGMKHSIDAAGNVYIGGFFRNTVDFDPGAGDLSLTASGTQDAFLAKYNTDGEVQWAFQLENNGAPENSQGLSTTTDANGNTTITGLFLGSMDIDPGAGVTQLNGQGGNDAYIATYNTDGDLLWGGVLGGNGNDVGKGVISDNAGNIFVTGTFRGTADFNLDPVDTAEMTSAGLSDVFLVKYQNLSTGNPLPNASFTFAENDLTIDFDGSGSTDDGTIVSWDWDFGDGNTDSGEFTSHTYAVLGTYDVTLTVTDDLGGTDAATQTIDVGNPPPVPSFTATQIVGILDVEFDASATTDDGSIVNWDWDFGDGNTGFGMTTIHPYAAIGTYTVTLTVTDNEGATAQLSMDVDVINDDPVASFTATQVGGTLDVDLDASASSDDGTIVSWDWDFGDGNTGAGEMATHTYAVGGTYTVMLTVTDNLGATGSLSMDVDVLNDDPVASFTTTQTSGTLDVDFDASASSDDGSIVSWDWDFGDSNTDVGETVSHTYAAAGTYTVMLMVTDNLGATGSLSMDVDVLNDDPVASFTTTQTSGTLDVDFDASASSDDGSIVSWDWDFGDSNTDAGETVSHTYAAAGTYTVMLTVTDNLGATGSVSVDVDVVENEDPVAAFMATQVTGTLDVDFDGAPSTDDGTIVSWDWDFGDGNTDAGETVSHTYAAFGTFTVMLTVTDDAGATNTATQDVDVVDPNQAPTAAFTATQVAGTLDVDFDGSASTDDGTITDWDWEFGDGNTGTGETTAHTYATAGTYTVMLTVTDDGGLTGSVSQDVEVTDPNAGGGAFIESGGMVVMEAENFHSSIDRSDHSWVENTANAGFSGASAMRADPDDGTSIASDIQNTSPELTFDMDLTTTGDYFVWVRAWADDSGDNSVHVGLEGAIDPLSKGVRWQTTGSWVWQVWSRGASSLSFDVSSAGIHTFNLWMRQDGAVIDKIVLTTDSGFAPTGEGPDESPQGAAPALAKANGTMDQLVRPADEVLEPVVEMPTEYSLKANYPNPFNPTTTIGFDLPEAADVRLEVYDMMGRRVATLVNSSLDAGAYEAAWNATSDAGASVASGVYLYRLRAGSFEVVKRMVLMK